MFNPSSNRVHETKVSAFCIQHTKMNYELICDAGLIQGAHFLKLWRNVMRYELKLDTEVEFGTENCNDACVCCERMISLRRAVVV